MTVEWSVVAALALLAAAVIRGLPTFHPAQLWVLPWLAVCALYALRLLPYNPLRTETAALIFASACVFCASAWLAGGRRHRRSRPTAGVSREHFATARGAATCLLVVSGVGLFAFLAQAAAAHGLRATLVTSAAVREGVQTGQFVFTIKFVYVALAAALASALVAALAEDRSQRRRWLALALLPVFAMYFSTGRSNLVTALVMAVLTYLVARPVEPHLRQVGLGMVAAGVVFVVTLTVGGIIIGKTFEASELARMDSPFTRHAVLEPVALPYQYATAPIAALNELIPAVGRYGASRGCATVPLACTLGSPVGVTGAPVPSIRVFTAAPLEWNTYTALDAPVLDAGPVIAVLIVAALGLLAGVVWAGARDGSPIMAVLYAVVGTATVSSVIQNNFFAFHYMGAILLFAVAWLLVDQLSSRGQAFSQTRLALLRLRGGGSIPPGPRL